MEVVLIVLFIHTKNLQVCLYFIASNSIRFKKINSHCKFTQSFCILSFSYLHIIEFISINYQCNTKYRKEYVLYYFERLLNSISWSVSNSIHFSSRSTSSHIISKENSVVIYSGLESGHIVETTLCNNDINTKEIKLDMNSPVSSISVDRYTGAVFFFIVNNK